MIHTDYRHEWKHEINYEDRLILRQRLSAFMEHDPHTTNDVYFIRSVYFDNLYDKALREKIDGVNKREKFRIRYYDGNLDTLRLEKKSKLNGLGAKEICPITREEAERILAGDTDRMLFSDKPLIRELYADMMNQGLRPKTIVDYTREPFIYGPGNVRVTFDYDIRTSLSIAEFFHPDGVTIPAGYPFTILEVKWDNFLPDIVRDAVQMPGRRVGAFSKYAQCRIYG